MKKSTAPTLERWMRLWSAFNVDVPSQSIFESLIAAYNEPTRFYHTLQHLDACLEDFDRAREFCDHPAEVELALWFHDAIYDSYRSDNEEQSAAWMERVANEAGVPDVVVARVRSLILATRHKDPPTSRDAALLLDIDLAILGAYHDRFGRYEQNVRKEYGWVSDEQFGARRSRILRSFLDRDSIYSTEFFHLLLEERARENIKRSLADLEGRPSAEQ